MLCLSQSDGEISLSCLASSLSLSFPADSLFLSSLLYCSFFNCFPGCGEVTRGRWFWFVCSSEVGSPYLAESIINCNCPSLLISGTTECHQGLHLFAFLRHPRPKCDHPSLSHIFLHHSLSHIFLHHSFLLSWYELCQACSPYQT